MSQFHLNGHLKDKTVENSLRNGNASEKYTTHVQTQTGKMVHIKPLTSLTSETQPLVKFLSC